MSEKAISNAIVTGTQAVYRVWDKGRTSREVSQASEYCQTLILDIVREHVKGEVAAALAKREVVK